MGGRCGNERALQVMRQGAHLLASAKLGRDEAELQTEGSTGEARATRRRSRGGGARWLGDRFQRHERVLVQRCCAGSPAKGSSGLAVAVAKVKAWRLE
ncbi:hypothetical protein ACJRO7_006795 [Eucalyptus globulus]|uniref:Uncharacterized protein n=1 Tax=Eucalyptus globulus TaxID=34317 RepID=A0ABD3ILP5_EUCGL